MVFPTFFIYFSTSVCLYFTVPFSLLCVQPLGVPLPDLGSAFLPSPPYPDLC
jgi:hypothetical protein